MFNLNTIIYRLCIVLILEVSFIGIYYIVYNASSKIQTNVIVPNLTLSSTIEPVVYLNVESLDIEPSNLEPLPLKSVPLVKREEIKILSDVLVHISPRTQSDIVNMKNTMVKPIIYTKSIKLSDLSIEDKKKIFIDMMLPSILIAKHRMAEEREKVAKLLNVEELSKENKLWLTKKRYIFKATTIDELYNKMEVHPTSIVIAQAIIESGWGTSRFFEKANNVFGIWSFNTSEQRIAASKKRGDKTIYLKKYTSVEQSIFDYFLILSTKDVYQGFRDKRLESQDPFVLIKQLGKYSELGDEYILNLKNTIVKNKLLEYDSYSLDI